MIAATYRLSKANVPFPVIESIATRVKHYEIDWEANMKIYAQKIIDENGDIYRFYCLCPNCLEIRYYQDEIEGCNMCGKTICTECCGDENEDMEFFCEECCN